MTDTKPPPEDVRPRSAASALDRADPKGLFVDVAVPLPIHSPLVYRVPEVWAPLARTGCRAIVPVGKRRLTGWILATRDTAPPGVEAVRELDRVVDLEPVVTRELLQLARFTADYYLASIGEVLRAQLPSELPSWGARRVSLTSRGALGRPRRDGEREVVEELMRSGRMTVAELQSRLSIHDLPALLESLSDEGRVSLEESSTRSGRRYLGAVELPTGRLEEQLAACGRSVPGRAVVEHLAGLGRPATVHEVCEAVGCTSAVVRRLSRLGILRTFVQLERLSLEHHLLDGAEGSDVTLREDQAVALDQLRSALGPRTFSPFLLSGMTGSGKTEVYLRAVQATLEQGRTAILLVPEIALVPALAASVKARFGRQLAILHSGLRQSERAQEWERLRRGEARVVLGPRSAIFAPLAELGLVIVDEEQDAAYKQDRAPRYHGRDLALVRAQRAGAVAVLVSATPSLETRYNVTERGFGEVSLTARAGQGRLAEGILVDLRSEGLRLRPGEIHFSERLCQEIEHTLGAGDQIVLLRNRRGYSPLYLCRACGEDLRCDDCGLPRTFHRRERRLICHYCGSNLGQPRRCPSCGEDAMEAIGAGTERVEEEFARRFPGAAVDVLDRDSVRRRGSVAGVLERFRAGQTQVLIGTQMVSKGHHFPNVALAAVLCADTYLGFPDFRAVERTYALLVQLAGRAGRGEKEGRVVIQSYHPDHYAIRAALADDNAAFLSEEMRFRRIFHYPPYSRMIQLLEQGPHQERAAARLADIAERLEAHPLAAGVRVLGPAPAPLERLRGRWRFQLLLRGPSGSRLRRLVSEVVLPDARSSLSIDVDPYDLM